MTLKPSNFKLLKLKKLFSEHQILSRQIFFLIWWFKKNLSAEVNDINQLQSLITVFSSSTAAQMFHTCCILSMFL